ncbi:MAG: hypothetical protein AABX11_06070 [Nanoarchaeota archaeon]
MVEEISRKLVDELEKLERTKKDAEHKIENLKSEIANIAKLQGKRFINGTHKGCSVKEYEKVIYPEDKDSFGKLIKSKGLYEYYSQINYSRLSPAIIKRDINLDKEILDKVKIIKDFRVVLIDKGV